MKASEMVEQLNKLIKEHGDLDLVYAVDDEGNAYHTVEFGPGTGLYMDDEQMFICAGNFEDEEITDKPNAICIN